MQIVNNNRKFLKVIQIYLDLISFLWRVLGYICICYIVSLYRLQPVIEGLISRPCKGKYNSYGCNDNNGCQRSCRNLRFFCDAFYAPFYGVFAADHCGSRNRQSAVSLTSHINESAAIGKPFVLPETLDCCLVAGQL